MLPHYLVKNNSSDAACQIVDHTHNISTGSCQSHPAIHLLLGKTVTTLVSWILQTRHTTQRIEVTWILILLFTREVRHLYYNNSYTPQTKLLLCFTR